MEWVPDEAWLTKVVVDATADELNFDLAIDASGAGKPSPVDAGFAPFGPMSPPRAPIALFLGLAAVLVIGLPIMVDRATRSHGPPPWAGA